MLLSLARKLHTKICHRSYVLAVLMINVKERQTIIKFEYDTDVDSSGRFTLTTTNGGTTGAISSSAVRTKLCKE